MNNRPDELRKQILHLIKEYYDVAFRQKPDYAQGDRISYGGRVFDHQELKNGVESILDFWLTSGNYCTQFERALGSFLDVEYVALVNSGSSANLLSVSALTSSLLGDRRILPGDEIITVACAFPTTVTPIIQIGAVPVFVDVALPSGNVDVALLEDALSARTKAIILAHTLGNPFDVQAVKTFCDTHGLWLIEDNCDALGSKVMIDGQIKYTGTIGHIGTSSFYPPHHITMGEGGAVYTGDLLLHQIIVSMRDWGRDCHCPSGHDGVCGHRFDRQYGDLPMQYDHKYVYSHLGYNLKLTEMQAAIGLAQLEKLPRFIESRRQNWARLRSLLDDLSDYLWLPEPAFGSEPSWFGFLMLVKKPGMRNTIVSHLEHNHIQTRMLFAGNLLRHPCMSGIKHRVSGALVNSDRILNDAFWIGVYPGLKQGMLEAMSDEIHKAVEL